MWNFRGYTHNIRYVVPLFGIIFVFFGVFWGKVGEKFFKKVSWLPCLLVTLLLIISQYKIFFPIFNTKYLILNTKYFSPNTDFYGDVQIADYKTIYLFIQKQVPDYNFVTIFTDISDAHRWYMPEKNINTYFMKGIIKPYKFVDGGYVYGTLSDFLKQKAKYQKGIFIVEDWESFLPEDIKQYAKKNMKRIIRVEGLKEAPNDSWPLEVYIWGE